MGWIHAVIDLPAEQWEAGARFWEASLGWPIGPSWAGHRELSSFEPADGDAYVHLQRIEGPPRVHLDLEVADVPEARDRWAALGAEITGPPPEPPTTTWQAMRSPGGLAFCLIPTGHRQPPPALVWPAGHHSRLVQVCIDLPGEICATETAFWRAGLTGRWAGSSREEFLGKVHDDAGSPIQLLFQRLGEPTGPARAHLDLGTDDIVAEVERQIALGAVQGRADDGFVALTDPVGLAYCVTGNDPEATRRRDIGDQPWPWP